MFYSTPGLLRTNQQGSTQTLMELIFPNHRKLGMGTDGRFASGSVANSDNDGATQISIHHNATQFSTFHLVTSIERALTGTRSLDHRTNLDDPYVMKFDVQPYLTASMNSAELYNEMQSVH